MRKPAEFRNLPPELLMFAAEMPQIFGPYLGVIKHIVDGDTLDVYLDAGLNEYPYKVIRLRDIDTPELNSVNPEERFRARAAKEFVESVAPIGTPCVLYDNRKDDQTFGRYVGSIMLPGLRDLGHLLREAGHTK